MTTYDSNTAINKTMFHTITTQRATFDQGDRDGTVLSEIPASVQHAAPPEINNNTDN